MVRFHRGFPCSFVEYAVDVLQEVDGDKHSLAGAPSERGGTFCANARMRQSPNKTGIAWPKSSRRRGSDTAMRAPRPISLVVYDEHLMCLEGLAAAFDEDPTVAIVATTNEYSGLAEILEQRRPDICLFDVTCPDAPCIAALSELARRAPKTALVVMIVDPPPVFVRKAISVGVRGFARKDASLHSLRRTIDRVSASPSVVGADTVGGVTTPTSQTPARSSRRTSVDQLTNREREVLARMMAGDDTRHIAAALHVSRSTARTHVQNVRRKLGARTKLQAVALALGTATVSSFAGVR
jgi:two-component system, NarL family, nitrate/nitrite response regulator NarL